jgi:hypothetical protein
MRKTLVSVIVVMLLFTGCERTKEVAQTTKTAAVSVGKFAKKRIPILREILEAAVLAYRAIGEWNSGASWKTAVANAFAEFMGSEPDNDLEKSLEGMTDHQINLFYEKNKTLLDPLIEEHNQEPNN